MSAEELISDPLPFEIAEVDGAMVATNGQATMQAHRDEGGRLFRRRAQKINVTSGTTAAVEWAVAELDGVRVYFDGTNVVVTRRDLTP